MPDEIWVKASDRLGEATADLLFRQWRAIGAGASGESATAQVDPEALILASLAFQTLEKRLWLVMTDWLVEGARFISTQRLKNLLPDFGKTAAQELSRLAQSTTKLAKDPRWRSLIATARVDPLEVLPPSKRRSGGVRFQSGPALLLRLRAGFGMGVKADILAFLLGQEYRATVSAIAESLGCSTPTAFRALQDLTVAGFVMADEATAATEYKVAGQSWTSVLGKGSTYVWWRWWVEVFGYVLDVLATTERLRERRVSEYAVGVELRKTGERHAKALSRIRVAQLNLAMPDSARPADWIAFNDRISAYLTDWA